jgi:hypothetical protein
MGGSILEGKLLRRPGHLTMPHNIHSDQAIPPIKSAPLMMPKSAIRGYLVDEDKWDALSCYIIGHRVPVHRQDRHAFPFFLHYVTFSSMSKMDAIYERGLYACCQSAAGTG